MIKYTLILLGSFAARLLPLGLLYAVARVSGRMAYWLFGDQRKVAEANLDVVFPEGLDKQEKERLLKNLFGHIALNTVDLLRLPYSPFPSKFVKIEGMDHLTELYRDGKGVILISPHLGNFEVGGMLLAEAGFAVNVVTESIASEKTRFRKDRIASLYRKYRESTGMKTIPLENSSVAGLRSLKRGEMLVLLSDRDIVGSGIEVEFFGVRAWIPRGPALLAVRTGAPVVFAVCVRYPKGRLRAFVEPLEYKGDDVEEIAGLMVRRMERYIRQYPDQWFVFQPPWRR
jgi:KDO2-lipid IV(A) lauroyltransferase